MSNVFLSAAIDLEDEIHLAFFFPSVCDRLDISHSLLYHPILEIVVSDSMQSSPW
jgi:hypothetical protein